MQRSGEHQPATVLLPRKCTFGDCAMWAPVRALCKPRCGASGDKGIQPRWFETIYPHCMLASRALQSGYVEGLCACRIGLEAEGFT